MKIKTLELGNSAQREEFVFVYNEAHTIIEFIIQFNRDELKALLNKSIKDKK